MTVAPERNQYGASRRVSIDWSFRIGPRCATHIQRSRQCVSWLRQADRRPDVFASSACCRHRYGPRLRSTTGRSGRRLSPLSGWWPDSRRPRTASPGRDLPPGVVTSGRRGKTRRQQPAGLARAERELRRSRHRGNPPVLGRRTRRDWRARSAIACRQVRPAVRRPEKLKSI